MIRYSIFAMAFLLSISSMEVQAIDYNSKEFKKFYYENTGKKYPSQRNYDDLDRYDARKIHERDIKRGVLDVDRDERLNRRKKYEAPAVDAGDCILGFCGNDPRDKGFRDAWGY